MCEAHCRDLLNVAIWHDEDWRRRIRDSELNEDALAAVRSLKDACATKLAPKKLFLLVPGDQRLDGCTFET